MGKTKMGQTMRAAAALAMTVLSGCDGTAFNTTVAASRAVRSQMAASIVPGRTTETDLITRWGRPVQKVHEGAQVEYIYRDMRGYDTALPVLAGDSENYVIVTFQYGIATAVRTSETEICRATFPPRPPGPAWSNPTTVRPVDTCPGLYRPPVGPAGGPEAEGTAARTGPGPMAPGGRAGGTATGAGESGAGAAGAPDAAAGAPSAPPPGGGVTGADGIVYDEPIYSEDGLFPKGKLSK